MCGLSQLISDFLSLIFYLTLKMSLRGLARSNLFSCYFCPLISLRGVGPYGPEADFWPLPSTLDFRPLTGRITDPPLQCQHVVKRSPFIYECNLDCMLEYHADTDPPYCVIFFYKGAVDNCFRFLLLPDYT